MYDELNAVVDVLKSNNDFFNVLKSPLVSKGEKSTYDKVERMQYLWLEAYLTTFIFILFVS